MHNEYARFYALQYSRKPKSNEPQAEEMRDIPPSNPDSKTTIANPKDTEEVTAEDLFHLATKFRKYQGEINRLKIRIISTVLYKLSTSKRQPQEPAITPKVDTSPDIDDSFDDESLHIDRVGLGC